MTAAKPTQSHPGFECRVCGSRFAFGFRDLTDGSECAERGCLGRVVVAVMRRRAA